MEECVSGDWLARFACLIAAPQTAVDLTVTLFSALVAAAIAIAILRSQFRHDRGIAMDQLRRADVHAQAAARLPHVEQLARGLIALSASTRSDSSVASTAQLGIDVYANRESAAIREFDETWRLLKQHLPESQRDQVQALWGDVAVRWSACHDAARAVVSGPPPGGFHPDLPVPKRLGLAATVAMGAATGRAERVGLVLLSWDGFSDLDLRPALRGWVDRPRGRDREAEGARAIAEEFWRVMLAIGPPEDLPDEVRAQLQRKVGQPRPDWIRGPVFEWPS